MSDKDITFLRVMHLRGPNIWTYRPVIEVWLDIGRFEQFPSHTLQGFNQRLTDWLPGLAQHRCGVGEPGGFLLRLDEGTWIGHILEHVVLELQTLAGMRTGFGKTRQVKEGSGIYKMAFRTRNEAVGRMALEEARALVLAAVNDQPYDVAATVIKLTDMVDSLCLGPSTSCIVEAAGEQRIPFIRLTEGNLVQLGHGSRQRRIWTAETDRTSAIAEYISSDKDLTKRLLSSCGVPVPAGRIVESAEEAWEEAQDLGLPVVIKPVDGNHGRGVSIELSTKAHIEEAFELALRHGSEVIVERFIRGNEHRLLVVGGKVVAAARGESAWVRGDGVASIQELVDRQLNTDGRRGHGEDFPLNRIDLDQDVAIQLELARQGFDLHSVPENGTEVLIQRNGNVAIDCTDEVHADIEALVVLATQVVGLDIAGVDMVVEDISKPLVEQGGAIVEVNAGPGLLTHLKPAVGYPRPVGGAIISHLFPKGDRGRIPIVGIMGTSHTTEIARLVAWLLRLSGEKVGLACQEGLFLDRRQVSTRNSVNFDAGQRLLMNRTVSAVVIESDVKAVLKEGLSYDRSSVAIVTDTHGAESLSEFMISEDQQVFDVMRTMVDVVLPDGFAILNAAELSVMGMAPLCDGTIILYHASENLAAIIEHRTNHGRAVFVREGQVILARGKEELTLNALGSLKLNGSGVLFENTILAAAAATWAMGLPPELIRAGIETFEAEHALAQSPESSGKVKKKK